MPKRGVGYFAANGSSVTDYAEKRIVGHTDDGEGVSTRAQCERVKKALRSARKMNLGCNAAVLGGERSYRQNKSRGRKTRINFKEGQYAMYSWLSSKNEGY